MRMTWNKAWWLVAVLVSGCFQGPEMLEVGRLDGGAGGGAGGMTGGGTGGGGGSATGGGGGAQTGGGGGMQGTDAGFQLADAGLVPRLPVLPEANCKMPVPGSCANDGGCVEFLAADGGRTTVLTFGDDVPSMFGAGPHVLLQTNTQSGVTLRLGMADGTAPVIRTSATPSGFFVMPQTIAHSSWGTWFIIEHREPGMAMGRTLLASPGQSGTANAASAIDGDPTSNAAAVGSWYFAGLSNGISSYYPAGSQIFVQPMSVTGEEETVFALTSDDAREVFWIQCTTASPRGKCSLWRYESPLNSNPRQTVLVRELPQLAGGVGGATSLRVLGGHVYLLGVEYLLRIPRAGGALEVVYRGADFPQYGGTLKSGSLEVVEGKLYFGSVCHFDADYPLYGTVELDPATSTARWMELDPRWPLVPHLVDPEPFVHFSAPVATPAGTWVLRR